MYFVRGKDEKIEKKKRKARKMDVGCKVFLQLIAKQTGSATNNLELTTNNTIAALAHPRGRI